VLEIAPSTYYSAKTRPPSARAMADAVLMPILLALWVKNYSVYGRRKLAKAAHRAGLDVGRDQVERLMRREGIRGATRATRRFTTRSDPAAVRAPDLVQRDFSADRPDRTWVADFTYCSTWSGIVYVAFVIDVFSRRIVGWTALPTIRRELVLDAVLMAVRKRQPRGTLIHSDQGTQFGSDAWRRFCRSNHLEPSMSRKGNCWDNAVAESFFSSLKKERIKKQIYKNRDLAIADVGDYIETFYNRTRRHSHLGGLSPEQFEAAHTTRRQRLH